MIRVLENARIRFARGTLPTAKGPDLNVELGTAEVEATAEDLAIVTALGVARVERGARVRVSSDGERSTLEVVVGRAVVLARRGRPVVDEGEGAEMKRGDADPNGIASRSARRSSRRRRLRGAVAPPARARPQRGAASRPAPEDKPERAQNARADVTLEAGDSGTLHVAAGSLSLRLAFDKLCPGEASVEVKDGHEARSVTGSGAVVLKLRPGTVRYQLRCAGDARAAKPRATGALTVKRDSGDVPVSRRPPSTCWTRTGGATRCCSSTRLPALTLGWAPLPPAPRACRCTSSRRPARRRFTSPTARQQLASGTLAEGSYVWWYATADGRTSPKTDRHHPLRQRRTHGAVLSRALGRRADAPGLVAVDGVTIDGAKVSAGGRSLTVDERGPFPGHGRAAERRRRRRRPTRASAHRRSLLRAPGGIAATTGGSPHAR